MRARSWLALVLILVGGIVPAGAEEEVVLRVACVGDSITYGQAIRNREANCYPHVLQGLLGDGYHVGNFGVSGATLMRSASMPYWKLAAFKKATDFSPDLVVILLGTNDTDFFNWTRKKEFPRDLKSMIAHFSKLPTRPRVWVCTPPPLYGWFRKLYDKTLREEMIPMIREVTAAKGVPMIDLYTVLDGKPELFPDNIHPNADGARIIAETVHAAVTQQQEPDSKTSSRKEPAP